MTDITPEWLKKQMDGQWGARQKLADFLGLSHDKVSKMVNGQRRPQPQEIPKILEFFGVKTPEVDPELAGIWRELSPEEHQTLISLAKVLHAQHRSKPQDSSETD